MTTTIEPIQTADGIAYRVTRVFPNWASAQLGRFALDGINPADLEPPAPAAEPPPPNCDGFAESYGPTAALIDLHDEKDEP
jgi:hypothetical protein